MDSFGTLFNRGLLWCSLALISAALLPAQQPSGEIRIEVKDPSGAVVRAAGTLRNQNAGLVRAFHTDARGVYDFVKLPYGHYELQISRSRFATQSIQIDVQASTPISRIVTLALADASTKVEVVAATPLAGTDLTTDQIAGHVQTATAADVENSGALDLGDFMNRHLNGVYLNEMQSNPFQPDVNFRG